MVSGIDADRESVHRVAGSRKPVEFLDEVGDPLPELRRLHVGNARMPDESPQLPIAVCGDRLSGRDLEVVEVPRRRVTVWAAFECDVEHPRRSSIEALLDRAYPSRPHDS